MTIFHIQRFLVINLQDQIVNIKRSAQSHTVADVGGDCELNRNVGINCVWIHYAFWLKSRDINSNKNGRSFSQQIALARSHCNNCCTTTKSNYYSLNIISACHILCWLCNDQKIMKAKWNPPLITRKVSQVSLLPSIAVQCGAVISFKYNSKLHLWMFLCNAQCPTIHEKRERNSNNNNKNIEFFRRFFHERTINWSADDGGSIDRVIHHTWLTSRPPFIISRGNNRKV